MSEDHKRKISIANKGRKLLPMSDTHKEKIRQSKLGKVGPTKGKRWKLSEQARKNISAGVKRLVASGKHNLWKGGITEVNKVIRCSLEYRLWRESVFKRDDYTCRFCGKRGGEIHADHIKPFSLYPELRFAIDNGRVLCVECHRKTSTYGNGSKKKFNRLKKTNGR